MGSKKKRTKKIFGEKNLGKKKLWVKKFREFSLFSYHLSEDWRTALHETRCNRLLIKKMKNIEKNIGTEKYLGKNIFCVRKNFGTEKILGPKNI